MKVILHANAGARFTKYLWVAMKSLFEISADSIPLIKFNYMKNINYQQKFNMTIILIIIIMKTISHTRIVYENSGTLRMCNLQTRLLLITFEFLPKWRYFYPLRRSARKMVKNDTLVLTNWRRVRQMAPPVVFRTSLLWQLLIIIFFYISRSQLSITKTLRVSHNR